MLFRRSCLAVALVGSAVVGRAGCSHPVETVRTRHPVSSTGPDGTRDQFARRAAVSSTTTAPEPPPDVPTALRAISRAIGVLFPPTTTTTTQAATPVTSSPPVISVPMDVASVMACIRAHESGDYGNHSNGPEGASGAYQYVGSTWRAWSARAGYPGTSAAWLAAPAVQDAVTVYTLTHGGAGNWSPRWGDDPCTVGWGG